MVFSDINFFHCKKIVEILKETEAATKNIFGRYSSQRMKDWQEIVSLYERDNVYLGTMVFYFFCVIAIHINDYLQKVIILKCKRVINFLSHSLSF